MFEEQSEVFVERTGLRIHPWLESVGRVEVACTTDETECLVKPVCEPVPNPCSGAPSRI